MVPSLPLFESTTNLQIELSTRKTVRSDLRKPVVHYTRVEDIGLRPRLSFSRQGMTMVKEATELVTARALLKKAEGNLGDPGMLVHLRNAIDSLSAIKLGAFPQIQKDLARRLVLTYRNKVLSEVKAILANFDCCKPESLQHWHEVMQIFVDAGVDDPEFNACREQLLTQPSPSLDGLKPGDLDAMEKELREVLDSLSAHRNRLSNLKWSIRK
jgi:hypothetical protein